MGTPVQHENDEQHGAPKHDPPDGAQPPSTAGQNAVTHSPPTQSQCAQLVIPLAQSWQTWGSAPWQSLADWQRPASWLPLLELLPLEPPELVPLPAPLDPLVPLLVPVLALPLPAPLAAPEPPLAEPDAPLALPELPLA